MSSLTGKLVSQINIKSDGDVFHEIFRKRPHHISDITQTHVQKCALHEGDWGAVGSVIVWNYTHDGNEREGKSIVGAVDEANKSVTFDIVGEDLKEYKAFSITVHVDTTGDDNLVTWTFEYEKLRADVVDPQTMMDLCLNLTKNIEAHHLSIHPSK